MGLIMPIVFDVPFNTFYLWPCPHYHVYRSQSRSREMWLGEDHLSLASVPLKSSLQACLRAQLVSSSCHTQTKEKTGQKERQVSIS